MGQKAGYLPGSRNGSTDRGFDELESICGSDRPQTLERYLMLVAARLMRMAFHMHAARQHHFGDGFT